MEPEEEEKAKVLATIVEKIFAFKTVEELDAWEEKQNLEKSILKDEILEALWTAREALEVAASSSEPAEPEMSEADKLFAQIREVLEAAGHDPTYIEKRMEGIKKQSDVAVLKKILANEKKHLKNGNGNGKEDK